MKKQIILPAMLVLGLTFGSTMSKAQSTSELTKSSQTTEMSASTNNLMASTVETKTTLSENSSVNVKKQKPLHPKRKDWEDRTLAGKILIITGGVFFVILCLMFGTVTI